VGCLFVSCWLLCVCVWWVWCSRLLLSIVSSSGVFVGMVGGEVIVLC